MLSARLPAFLPEILVTVRVVEGGGVGIGAGESDSLHVVLYVFLDSCGSIVISDAMIFFLASFLLLAMNEFE